MPLSGGGPAKLSCQSARARPEEASGPDLMKLSNNDESRPKPAGAGGYRMRPISGREKGGGEGGTSVGGDEA